MVNFHVIYNTFTSVSRNRSLHDRWISDEVWYRCILHHHPDLATLDFDRTKLNRAISLTNKKIDDFSPDNDTGQFRIQLYVEDPFASRNPDGTFPRRKTWFYYITQSDIVPERPVRGNPAAQGVIKQLYNQLVIFPFFKKPALPRTSFLEKCMHGLLLFV